MREEYSQKELEKLLGLTRQMIWKYEKEYSLTSEKIGREKFFVNDERLQQLLKEKQKAGTVEDHEKRIVELERLVVVLMERLNNLPIVNESQQVNETLNILPVKKRHVKKTSNSLPIPKKQVKKALNPVSTQESTEMKRLIEEAIEKGIHKSKICPKGKGSQLGKWLKGESHPNPDKIKEWFENAKELLGNN